MAFGHILVFESPVFQENARGEALAAQLLSAPTLPGGYHSSLWHRYPLQLLGKVE